MARKTMGSKIVHVILNPIAGGGKAHRLKSRILTELSKRFEDNYSLHVTNYPGDATVEARRAIENGAELVITVGGDGTTNEIINGLLEGNRHFNPSVELGIVNCGTGRGMAQTLGLPDSIELQVDIICRENSSAIDVGLVTFRDSEGKRKERAFLSECQVGIGGSVVAALGPTRKRLGGRVAFGSVAIMQLLTHKAHQMTVHFDNREKIEEKIIGLVVGNGSHCGGGMKLTPDARPDDGLFDVLLIYDMNILKRLWNFPKIYHGKHIDLPQCSLRQSKCIFVDTEDPALMVEADGELLGTAPCKIELLPSALKVRCDLSAKG